MTKEHKAIGRFSSELCKNISENLAERTDDFRAGDGFETATNSTLSTLLARQSALALGLAESPMAWTGHIAPLILRSMIDLLITYRWILIEPQQRSQEYISYGLGMEKLLTANYQEKLAGGFEGVAVEKIIESNLEWIESQRFQMFIEINLGSWTGVSVRKMCEEIGDPDLYKFSYTPFSACVHNSWNHVGKWNSRLCQNPLHKQHEVGFIPDVWPIVDFVYRSCKYLELVLIEFDRFYEHSSKIASPINTFHTAVADLAEVWNTEESDA